MTTMNDVQLEAIKDSLNQVRILRKTLDKIVLDLDDVEVCYTKALDMPAEAALDKISPSLDRLMEIFNRLQEASK